MRSFFERYRIQILFLIVILFFVNGGMVDYWQSAMEHKKYISPHLLNYFVFVWLVFYTGIWPFLMVFVASNYDKKIAKLYVAAFLIGSALWDMVYSYNESGYLVVGIKDYLYFGNWYFGLTQIEIIIWHFIRIISGLVIIKNTVKIKDKKWIS